MARIRWQGQEYIGEPVRLLDDGTTWRFKMHQHGPRWAAGAEIDVKQGDIIEMAAAELPIIRDSGIAALEVAMAAGRENLPTVQDLLRTAREEGTLVNPKQPEEAA